MECICGDKGYRWYELSSFAEHGRTVRDTCKTTMHLTTIVEIAPDWPFSPSSMLSLRLAKLCSMFTVVTVLWLVSVFASWYPSHQIVCRQRLQQGQHQPRNWSCFPQKVHQQRNSRCDNEERAYTKYNTFLIGFHICEVILRLKMMPAQLEHNKHIPA